MKGKYLGLVIATVAVAMTLILSATSSAAPLGVDITVSTGGSTAVISDPGCLNYDGGVRSFDLVVRTGAWVSNGFDPHTASWVTLVSNGVGNYRLVDLRALHVCGGTDVNEALAELRKIDEGGYNNPRIVVNPISVATATPTVTQTRTPNPTATATRTVSPTATPTATATATAEPGAIITPTPTLGVFSHTLVVVKTSKGVVGTTDSPGCLNYDPEVDKWVTQVTVLSGVWVSNGQETVFGCDAVAASADGIDCEAPWETLWGAEKGFYALSFAAQHVCGGRTFEEALSELRKIDPGGAQNPLRRIYPVRGLPTVYLPVIRK